jgi:hypothetical protein
MTVTIKMPDEPAFTATVDDGDIPAGVANVIRAKHPRGVVSATWTDAPGARTGTVRINGTFGWWKVNR